MEDSSDSSYENHLFFYGPMVQWSKFQHAPLVPRFQETNVGRVELFKRLEDGSAFAVLGRLWDRLSGDFQEMNGATPVNWTSLV